MENELSESKSVNTQVMGEYADLWGLMVVGYTRVVGSGESKSGPRRASNAALPKFPVSLCHRRYLFSLWGSGN